MKGWFGRGDLEAKGMVSHKRIKRDVEEKYVEKEPDVLTPEERKIYNESLERLGINIHERKVKKGIDVHALKKKVDKIIEEDEEGMFDGVELWKDKEAREAREAKEAEEK